jgi:nitrite reductase (NADH) large subunit
VRRGQLSAARARGCVTADQLARETGASTVCGSCRPLLAELAEAPALAAPVPGRPSLLIASLAALTLGIAFLALNPLPFAESVQTGWAVDLLWRDGSWKKLTGFTLLGITAMGLSFSLRKRISRFKLGEFGYWRSVHAILGALTLAVLVTHTGFRLGHNLNFILMTNFLALALAGALAGSVTAAEQRLSRRNARRLRALWTSLHVVLFWPLPVLIFFHVLTAYYF